jgi:PTH1 family peptidyl-tRNA hydrolase
MNRSGEAVARLLRYGNLGPENLLVLHDDLDLPLGTVRVKPGGGHGGHNGLRSVMDSLGTGEFRRVKVGIGRPAAGRTAEAWVLEAFAPDERPVADEAIARAADEVDRLLTTE